MAAPSVYSFDTSLDAERFIDDFNGRAFNALNDAYFLPSDEIEWERLDKQHIALRIALGSLTPCQEIIDAVLSPADGVRKRVLDIGCGTGMWAMEMARQYPHASVVGVDLSPPPLEKSAIPPNLRFEIDDVNHGLAHFYNKFDFVHVRCVGTGIRNYPFLMDEVENCLNPGGLVIYMEGDVRILSHDQLHPVRFPGQNGQISWFRKLIYEAIEACTIAGSSYNVGAELMDKGLWDHPMCDPTTAVGGAVILPIGPWVSVYNPAESQKLQYAGVLMRQVFLNVHRGYHRILLNHGLDQATLDAWSAKADDELNSMDTRTWVRFRFCWARKRASANSPAPPLPPPPPVNIAYTPGSDTSDPMSIAEEREAYYYPYLHFFYSPNEMAFETQRRSRADVPLPPFDVRRSWERKQLDEMVQG